MKDGYLGKCKECTKLDVKNHRSENILRIREYDRNRPSRVNYEYTKKYRSEFPNKYKAHSIINNMIKSGKLKRHDKCEKCGSIENIVAHHCDYLKPLDVNWFCEICHKSWHLKHGEGKNGKIK